MNDIIKICSCTGHRPKGFTWNYNDKDCESHKAYLKKLQIIIEKFIKEGFNYFISGGAIGADMDFAETIIRLRNKYPFIKLEIAVPCKNQSLLWTSNQKVRYENILMCADKVNLISEKYTSQCMYERNRYLVDSSDLSPCGLERIRKWGNVLYHQLRKKEK